MARAHQLVTERFDQAKEYANDAWELTGTFLNELSTLVSETVMPVIDLDYEVQSADLTTDLESKRPEAPSSEELSISSIVIPTSPVLAGMPEITIPTLPTLSAVAPIVSFVDAPDASIPEIPSDIPDLNDINVPSTPIIEFPDLPTIEQFALPTLTVTSLPQFDVDLPVNDLTAPEPMYNYSEASYSSDVLDALKAKVLAKLEDGSTGLDPEVEQAIWDRARSRQEVENLRQYREAEEYFAARGFTMPPGMLAGRLEEILIEIGRNNSYLNNDILTEQARLAQTNEQNILNASLQLETLLTNFTNTVAQRGFDAAKYTVESALAIFVTKVQHYNTMLDTYKTAAAVFELRIRAAVEEIEIYKAQLEGIKLNVEIQNQYVEVYKTQLAGIETLVNVYKTQMEGAGIAAQIERAKLDNYKTKIEAYTAMIGGKTASYNLYQAQIAGEVAKVQVFSEQVKSYTAQVDAVKSISDMELVTLQKVQLDNKAKLDAYMADIERYKVDLASESARIDAVTKVYGAKVAMYDADSRVASIELDTQLKSYDLQIQQAKAKVDLGLKEAEIALDNARNLLVLQVEATKAGANVAAQVIASSLSSVNASAGISYNDSDSTSVTTSDSESHSSGSSTSISYIHTYDETK